MARSSYSEHVNSRVGRDAAEKLQEQLFLAAQQALASAMADGNIPASLLSSCHQILRDSGLSIDLSPQRDDGVEELGPGDVSPTWLRDLQSSMGL